MFKMFNKISILLLVSASAHLAVVVNAGAGMMMKDPEMQKMMQDVKDKSCLVVKTSPNKINEAGKCEPESFHKMRQLCIQSELKLKDDAEFAKMYCGKEKEAMELMHPCLVEKFSEMRSNPDKMSPKEQEMKKKLKELKTEDERAKFMKDAAKEVMQCKMKKLS